MGEVKDDYLLCEGGGLDRKWLEMDRGYLVYSSRTYRSIVPYLKGIHQNLDSWKAGRNVDDWRLSREELRELYATSQHNICRDTETSVKVQAVPRLKSDMFALGKLLEGNAPYKVPV